MQALIEDFGQYLRHERGQSEHTQKAYCNILNRFADWAKGESIERWNEVTLTHLLGYLQHQREDNNPEPEDELKKRGVPQRIGQTQHSQPIPRDRRVEGVLPFLCGEEFFPPTTPRTSACLADGNACPRR